MSTRWFWLFCVVFGAGLSFMSFADAAEQTATVHPQFRGVYFNPLLKPETPDFPWLCFYPEFRPRVKGVLAELVEKTGVNLVDIFVAIAYSLKNPAVPPKEGQPLSEWANIGYLDGVAAFVDDCAEAGVFVELDLASNMWIPHSVDPEHQIGDSGYWPRPDETPWDESAKWFRETIEYVESRVKHPENIAMWSMMGNYELGTAEPCLWDREDNPAVTAGVEEFVKRVWPIFRASGKRPKASPYALPLFSNNSYWMRKGPEERLSAFRNLKKWLVDDLGLPPDYWMMSSYPFCDPAPDGVWYFKRIIEILGPENASKIVSTDLKGPGHDDVKDCIVGIEGRPGPEILKWHFKKCAEYGFAGWWIWAYQDSPTAKSGLRDVSGGWKDELVQAVKAEVPAR
jgi:hypothetical protein